jgi:hypothetical protein
MVNLADDNLDKALDMMVPDEEISAADRETALAEIRDYLENDMSSNESYGDYAPMLIAGVMFSELMVAIIIISWLPPIILWLIFLILVALKVIRKRTHSIEVTRLSIE